jgi:hypothetical protein
MLKKAPVALVGYDDVEDDDSGGVRLQHAAKIEPASDFRDMQDEDYEPRDLYSCLQQLDQVGIGIDDGNNRRRRHVW